MRDDINAISLHREDFSNLIKFDKNFYLEHPDVAARTQQEVDAYRVKKEITVEGADVPKPVTSFDEASFPGALPVQLARPQPPTRPLPSSPPAAEARE